MQIDDIIKLTESLQARMKGNLPLLSKEIEGIIKSKGKSVKRIETLLDVLLDYTQLGVGESEFLRLNRYYSSFQPENAKFYEDFYKDLAEED